MPTRAVNLALLWLVTLELASGLGSLLVGTPAGRWVFWTHGGVGCALVVVLGWKARIAWRSYGRRGLTAVTAASTIAAALFVGALATGLLWATTGLPDVPAPGFGSLSGLGLHIALALALIPLFVAHCVSYWPRPRRIDVASRRAALRALALAGGGFIVWRGLESATALTNLSGAERRFTGSREQGSWACNAFPTTNWFTDPVPELDGASWRLRVRGAVARPLTLTLAAVAALPPVTHDVTLDCTSGWYTRQTWRGVALTDVLAAAAPHAGARSVVVRSHTGYTRRYALDDAARLLLATHVGAQALESGHGYPLRLVAPGRRGFAWVKWVVELEVSSDPAWLQWPLPTQ